jgi:hypothetical protein
MEGLRNPIVKIRDFRITTEVRIKNLCVKGLRLA